ncbi:hypothetical protein ED28_03210 [[Pantoea] beijingensis]|uniref:Uncharacterized protein n=1 Tax=[Pantoea] beijingensis TaxID=1324864 RepID=A0A443IGY5_9GAMM|nr:hypothetical protein ED28_03210 [[Pantoea] beijingensis]
MVAPVDKVRYVFRYNMYPAVSLPTAYTQRPGVLSPDHDNARRKAAYCSFAFTIELARSSAIIRDDIGLLAMQYHKKWFWC